MIADKRLWRTDQGGDFVLDGDPKARVLAYGEGDEVSKDDEANAKKALGSKSDVKQADAPKDKQRAAASDKSK